MWKGECDKNIYDQSVKLATVDEDEAGGTVDKINHHGRVINLPFYGEYWNYITSAYWTELPIVRHTYTEAYIQSMLATSRLGRIKPHIPKCTRDRITYQNELLDCIMKLTQPRTMMTVSQTLPETAKGGEIDEHNCWERQKKDWHR